ncbi:MAG: hypothetical protein F6K17_26585 [Okeania sp. SIO3C4]|nr:hypothetical protein [Okeania sp. SIO3C4]
MTDIGFRLFMSGKSISFSVAVVHVCEHFRVAIAEKSLLSGLTQNVKSYTICRGERPKACA